MRLPLFLYPKGRRGKDGQTKIFATGVPKDERARNCKAAGDMLLPTFSEGTPDIDDGVYEYIKELWDEECNKKEGGNYRAIAFSQGSKKSEE